MLGPIAFTNAYFLAGDYAIAFGLLALPAAIGLGCVFAAHHVGARVAVAQAGS